MTDCYRSVPVKEKFGDREADDLAAADHDSILSGNLIIGILKKPYDSHRGARDNAGGVRSLLPKGSGVERVKAVNVFGLGYGLDHFRFADLLRERKLDKDAVNGVVSVELGDLVEEYLLRGVGRHPDCGVPDSYHVTGLGLVPDVGLAAGVVSHQDHDQMRDSAIFCRECGHLLGHSGL